MSTASTFKQLPTWAKGLIAVAVVGGTGFAAWKVYKVVQKRIQSKSNRMTAKESKKELQNLAEQGIKPTYSDSQFANWAQTLVQAFDGCGTGSEKLYNIFGRMNNDADIHKLIETFGTRTFDKCGIGTGDFTGDLTSAIAYKFSGVEGALNPYVITNINTAFQKKGIKFKF